MRAMQQTLERAKRAGAAAIVPPTGPLAGQVILAGGVDLGSEEAGEVQREILRAKPSLRRVYEQVYAKMLAAAAE